MLFCLWLSLALSKEVAIKCRGRKVMKFAIFFMHLQIEQRYAYFIKLLKSLGHSLHVLPLTQKQTRKTHHVFIVISKQIVRGNIKQFRYFN